MATLGSTYLDIVDVLKRTNPDNQIAAIIEILNQHNPVLDDAVAIECNDGTRHQHSIRTGLPTVTWGKLYQGIPQSKSTTQQVVDTTGYVEALATIDQRLLNLSKNRAATRLSESSAFMESMAQEVASGIFYHDVVTTPEKFKGLAARYNTIGGGGAGNQVISAGGSGSDNTSIWFITWGDRFTSLLHPEGVTAGLKREDMGRQRVLDSNGNPYYVEEEMFTWHVGVSVADWRYNARIANVDISDIKAGTVDLYGFMRNAYYKLQNRIARGDAGSGRQAIYCNRDVLEALDALGSNAGASDNFTRLRPMEVEGKEVQSYRGIPIRQTDALLNTESVVS